ncbi:MAG: amidohydrolase family protein [Actinomycetia bacterium]|nr:amidohydrolase family protein [Actinomycetes bacterium]
MDQRPLRVVDPHVHLWDPARTDWYPYLSGARKIPVNDVAKMARPFDLPTYNAEAAGWNVDKLITVSAATGAHCVDEAIEMEALAESTGQPAAIVGGITPSARQADVTAQLDRQMTLQRFRGVRAMGKLDHPVPAPAVLQELRDRGLVFDLMARTDQLVSSAGALADVDGLLVVVEHLGWPRSAEPEEFSTWQEGIRALADLGDRVTCKLSGLAMPLGSVHADVLAPWLEFAIECFGVERCMFASNFPVDGAHCTLDELFSAYFEFASGLGADALQMLFATNAERVYRC